MNDILSLEERQFLRQHRFPDSVEIAPISGGANNRIFRVGRESDAAILKRYFRSSTDSRDRFRAEQEFYAHAHQAATTFVSPVLGWAKEIGCALFAYIPGRKLRSDEIGANQIRRAADFIERLNQGGRPRLAPASDSAFSVEENRKSIQRRIDLLTTIKPETNYHQKAIELVRDVILPRWEKTSGQLTSHIGSELASCATEERVLSPSDFGFHNALCDEKGTLIFLDFEYAGEDDPAKMVCDFFSQPEIPVPDNFFPIFAESIIGLLPKARQNACRFRIETLRPAIHLKWCGIMLNDFLPAGQSRRTFALSDEELRGRHERQIGKVTDYLKRNVEPTSIG